jgi:hypothetical protein
MVRVVVTGQVEQTLATWRYEMAIAALAFLDQVPASTR